MEKVRLAATRLATAISGPEEVGAPTYTKWTSKSTARFKTLTFALVVFAR